MPKKIFIHEIYAEVDVDFDFVYPYEVSKKTSENINNAYIEDGLMLDRYKDYQIAFIITTKDNTLENIAKTLGKPEHVTDEYIVCRPSIRKKSMIVEYVIYLPYRDIKNSNKPLQDLLSKLSSAVSFIFEKLEYKQENIDKIIKSIV